MSKLPGRVESDLQRLGKGYANLAPQNRELIVLYKIRLFCLKAQNLDLS